MHDELKVFFYSDNFSHSCGYHVLAFNRQLVQNLIKYNIRTGYMIDKMILLGDKSLRPLKSNLFRSFEML